MKRKSLIASCVLIALGLFFLLWAASLRVRVNEYNDLLSGENPMPGYAYEGILKEIARLEARILPVAFVGFLCLLCGVSLMAYARVRRWSVVLVVLLVCASIEPVAAAPAPEQIQTRWYAEMMTPTVGVRYGETVYYDEVQTTLCLEPNTVTEQFVAFMLSVGNKATDEWLAIGAYQNRSGYWLYTDSKINGAYNKVVFGWAAPWEIYQFKIVDLMEGRYGAWLGGIKWGEVTFANTDGLVYGVTSESPYVYNTLRCRYLCLRVGFWGVDWGRIRSGDNTLRKYYKTGWSRNEVILHTDPPYKYWLQIGYGVTGFVTYSGQTRFRGGGPCHPR